MNKKDDGFYTTLYDKNGNPVRVLKEQLEQDTISESSGFHTYDSSHGHCAFCGQLSCRGGCMGGS